MTDFATLEIRADSRQVKTAGKALTGMGVAAGGLTRAMRALLPALTAVLSIRALSRMASEAREFGAAIGEVSTLLDDLDQMPRITQESKNLAAQFGSTPTEQAKAFYQAISAGAANAEAATTILTTANMLAVGGVTDITTAVSGLTNIINAFGLEADDAASVSDALFVAMRAGNTTVQQLSDGIGKVASLANATGISFEELLASTSALTLGGVATSEAFTQMKAVIAGISKPIGEAEEAAEKMGLSFDFATLKSLGLQDFLELLTEKTGGSEEKMLELFGSMEAVGAIFALTGAGAKDFSDIMVDMVNKTGQTERAFGLVSDKMDQKLKVLGAQLGVVSLEVGEFLLGLAEPIVDHLSKNFDDYRNMLIKTLGETRLHFQGMSAALLPFKDAWNLMLTTIGGWISDFSLFASQEFNKLGISGLTVSELITIGFGNMVSGVKAGIQANTIEIAAFFDRVGFWMRWAVGKANEAGDELTAIDMARKSALEAVGVEYLANNQALAEYLIQARLTRGELELLDTATDNLAGGVEDLTDDVVDLNTALSDTESDTEDLTSDILELNTGLGNTKSGIIGMVDPLTELSDEFSDLTEDIDDSEAALKRHDTMIESVQRSWEGLIFDTLSSGKIEFKSFFESILIGYQRMVAGILAENLAGIIFGGRGLGTLFTGVLSGAGAGAGGTTGGGPAPVTTSVPAGAGGTTGSGTTGSGTTGGATTAAAAGASVVSGGFNTTAVLSRALDVGANLIAGFAGSAAGNELAGLVSDKEAESNIGAVVGGAIGSTAGPLGAFLGATLGGFIDVLSGGDGFERANAGFLLSPVGGGDQQFNVPAFASGFEPVGFARRADEPVAIEVIDLFRDLDQSLTNAMLALGIIPSLSATSFSGFNEEAQGTGLFFGGAAGDNPTPLNDQLNQFAVQWITSVGRLSGIDADTISSIIGDGTAAGIVTRANDLAAAAVLQTGLADATALQIELEAERQRSIFGGESFQTQFTSPSQTQPADDPQMVRARILFGDPVQGSFAGGLDRVPFDGFLAELHRGERVQTASQADQDDQQQGGITGVLMGILNYIIKSWTIIDEWDINGIPPERA